MAGLSGGHAALVRGVVTRIISEWPGCQELMVQVDGRECKAINYAGLTGPAAPGERVILNTTAVELGLGSGGYHFVWLNLEKPEQSLRGPGHMMKLRYTPWQLRVLSVEEEDSPHAEKMKKAACLEGMAVIVAELHSMLAPVVLTLKEEAESLKVVYVMTDGGALPAMFSRHAALLRREKKLEAVISCGHAFGGDLEAVNVYSGLLAARHVLAADVAVLCMGPGVAGTGTRYGFSGIETGENINRVAVLGGRAVAVPRISFSDPRPRHRGLSHHTLTALGEVAAAPAELPLPALEAQKRRVLLQQLKEAGLDKKHRVTWVDETPLEHLLRCGQIACTTMGRGVREDPDFFKATVAAARHAAALVQAGN